MEKPTPYRIVAAYGWAHLAVDLVSQACLFRVIASRSFDPTVWLMLGVLYNTIAFALQPVLGAAVDRFRSTRGASILGCVLVAMGPLIIGLPIAAIVVSTFGNALFHVAGGRAVLRLEPGRARFPGLYVAPGGIGLWIGISMGSLTDWSLLWTLIPLIVSIAFIGVCDRRSQHVRSEGEEQHCSTSSSSMLGKGVPLVLLLLLMAVACRGFLAVAPGFPWKKEFYWGAAIVLFVTIGKGGGGFVADRFGWFRTAFVCQLVAVLLLGMGFAHPYAGLLGAMFFNFAMPITLTATASLLPNREGFAFGLTALALCAGAFPVFLGYHGISDSPLGMAGTVALVAIVLLAALHRYDRLPLRKGIQTRENDSSRDD